MGTKVARGTGENVEAKINQHQEENAATELKRGKRCEGV